MPIPRVSFQFTDEQWEAIRSVRKHWPTGARRAVRAMERGRAEVVIARGGRFGVASRAASEAATRLLGINRAMGALAQQRYPAQPDAAIESDITAGEPTSEAS